MRPSPRLFLLFVDLTSQLRLHANVVLVIMQACRQPIRLSLQIPELSRPKANNDDCRYTALPEGSMAVPKLSQAWLGRQASLLPVYILSLLLMLWCPVACKECSPQHSIAERLMMAASVPSWWRGPSQGFAIHSRAPVLMRPQKSSTRPWRPCLRPAQERQHACVSSAARSCYIEAGKT